MALQRKEATVNLKHIRQTFVRGVKGSSPMIDFQTYFNMVWSFPLEYMRGVLIGPVEQLWDTWVKKGIISAQDIRNINEHLALIKPVAEIHRLPRSLCKKSKWKASEWKSWLLFFSFPCLKNYLPAIYLEHFTLLVDTIFTMLKTKITEDELRRCNCDIIQFVGEFEILYGEEAMTFNVHFLLHIVQSVRYSGPLWANSAFPFESFLFTLKQYVTGTKQPEQQMAKKALNILHYKYVVDSSIFHSETAQEFCKSIFSKNMLSTYVAQTLDGIMFSGRSREVKFVNPENNETISGESFIKCVYKGSVYKSKKNTLSCTRNDTVVKLISGKVVEIEDIMKTDLKCYLLIRELIVEQQPLVRHMFTILRKERDLIIIPISEVYEILV